MSEFTTSEIERLLHASRDEIVYPPTPDLAGSALARIQPVSAERGRTIGLLATPAHPQLAPHPIAPPTPPETRPPTIAGQFLKLAAAIFAFVAIGGLLVAIFQLTDGTDEPLGAPATGTASDERLYVLTNVPERDAEPAYGRFTAYDASTHAELYTLDVAYAAQVAVSPDGSRIYLKTADDESGSGGLIAINASDGSTIWRALGLGSGVGYISGGPPSMARSADGSRLLLYTRAPDGQTGYRVRVIDARNGTTIDELEVPETVGCSPQLHLSQSNRRVYFACWTGSRVRIADLGMAQFTYDIPLLSPADRSGADRIAGSVQSPDGRYIYLVSDGPRVNVINTGPGAPEATHDLTTGESLPIHRGLVALSPDGTRLAIGIQTVGHDNGLADVGRIIVVDTTTWATVADLTLDPALPDPSMTGHSMTFSPDGSTLYVSATRYEAGTVNIVDSSSVTEIDITTGKNEVVIEAEQEQVWRVFSGRVTESPDEAGADESWTPSLLLTDANAAVPGPDKLQIRPIDPDTFADITGFTPISIGQHWNHALSPDRRTLAAFIWPTQEPLGGTLQLLDLETWQTTIAPVSGLRSVSSPLFTEDSQSLYWVDGTYVEGTFVLWRYDPSTGHASIVTQFPDQLVPWDMQMFGDNRLAVFGVPTDSGNLNAGTPRLVIVNLDDGAIETALTLEAVKVGQFREDVPRMYRPGLAWDTERSMLYIAHADEDVITRVDLARGDIAETTAFTQRQSRIDRLRDWFAPPAAASPVPWTSRQAIISADGSRLFIAPGTSWNNWWQEDLDRFPLQVIDTSDLSESRVIDVPSINDLRLSPDGRLLILQTFVYDTDANGQRIQSNQQLLGLAVDDLQRVSSVSLAGIASELEPSTIHQIAGYSGDGRWLYLTQRSSTDGRMILELARLDLETWTLTTMRTFDNTWYGELIVLQ